MNRLRRWVARPDRRSTALRLAPEEILATAQYAARLSEAGGEAGR